MITDHFLVTDQVAIVTGAGRGIGRATALALAEAGADLVISARTADQLEEVKQQVARLGRRAVCVTADLSDLATLPGLVETATGQFGRLDIVVNNVGGSFPRPLLETSAAMFEKAFHFNVTTALELSKAAIPAMLASDPAGGSIVNISSAIGRMTDRGFAAYGTAKAALTHLTRLMATECAPRIRVNAIAVGSTATSALESVLTNPVVHKAMVESTPLRRLGEPEDIALGALYLASPASAFVTGTVMEIHGGISSANLDLALAGL